MPRKSKKQLLQTYQDIPQEEFIGLLVHDVRGPLSSIISASKLMEVLLSEPDEIEYDQLQELVKIIQKATGNIRHVLEAAIEYDRLHQQADSDSQD
jgi:signal transduction histidine kinase